MSNETEQRGDVVRGGGPAPVPGLGLGWGWAGAGARTGARAGAGAEAGAGAGAWGREWTTGQEVIYSCAGLLEYYVVRLFWSAANEQTVRPNTKEGSRRRAARERPATGGGDRTLPRWKTNYMGKRTEPHTSETSGIRRFMVGQWT